MTDFEKYVLVLCVIVMAIFVILFSVFLGYIVKLLIQVIRLGGEDKKILKEAKTLKKRKEKKRGVCGKILSAFVCLLLCGVFAFTVYLNVTELDKTNGHLSWKVVKSGSMSYKAPENKYLVENGLDDQIQTFDLIVTEKLPDEFDLKLYDIVVYEVDGDMIIHRIVKIEEPNEKHPDKRYFLLQGDAVKNPDQFPVYYSQMRGIYRGKRVPFVGSFITFMQSPAGYLCMILILFAFIATPIMEKKIDKEMQKRLALLEKEKSCGAGANGQAGKQPQVYAAYMPAYYFAGYYVMPTVAQQPQRQNNEQKKKKKK
ncbi:MAG: hypothetical protein E7357_05865 [Clostridiales bacterium]|nr:hypothetical protein [Clostridiales bacterium]